MHYNPWGHPTLHSLSTIPETIIPIQPTDALPSLEKGFDSRKTCSWVSLSLFLLLQSPDPKEEMGSVQ